MGCLGLLETYVIQRVRSPYNRLSYATNPHRIVIWLRWDETGSPQRKSSCSFVFIYLIYLVSVVRVDVHQSDLLRSSGPDAKRAYI